MVSNYRKTYVDMDKTDHLDAFLISDFVRVGRTKKCESWRGSQYLTLKRLTRHRLHLAECITREKTYMVSNLYLKSVNFSYWTMAISHLATSMGLPTPPY